MSRVSRVSRVPVHGGNPRRGDDSNGRNEIITCGHHQWPGRGVVLVTVFILQQHHSAKTLPPLTAGHHNTRDGLVWSVKSNISDLICIVSNDEKRLRYCKFLK